MVFGDDEKKAFHGNIPGEFGEKDRVDVENVTMPGAENDDDDDDIVSRLSSLFIACLK